MALSSSSSNSMSNYNSHPSGFDYDVFLSFRGQDTRKAFTDHLYTELQRTGIRTFRDDDAMDRGKLLKPELEKGIQQSQVFVIVFSKGYATSKWCLDEVLMIMEECEKPSSKHEVIPVFYNVEPSDVRHQTGCFEEAFKGYDDKIRMETDNKKKEELRDKVIAWRASLKKAGSLTGMVLAGRYEAKFVSNIVNVIRKKVNYNALYIKGKLVGVKKYVAEIESWLQDPSPDSTFLVIDGMGGIGKTTIAKCIYNMNYREYDGSCFLAKINETSIESNGIPRLQSQLLSTILKSEKEETVSNEYEGTIKVEEAILKKKVLLVLDDVATLEQLEALLGRQMFYPGSKVIITSRGHGWLSTAFKVPPMVQTIRTLSNADSVELFSLYAFPQNQPIEPTWKKLISQVTHYCEGLPLALELLGLNLRGKSIAQWKDTISMLEKHPLLRIQKVLQLSYDSLEHNNDKDVFLHIACFFVGKDEDFIVKVLAECNLHPVSGIRNLNDRSLLYIEDGKVGMHQLISEMGKEVVRQESPKDPGERSRLCEHEDCINVLQENEKLCTFYINNIRMSDTGPSKDDIRMFTEFIQKEAVRTQLLKAVDTQLSSDVVEKIYGISKDELRRFAESIYKDRLTPETLSPFWSITSPTDQLYLGAQYKIEKSLLTKAVWVLYPEPVTGRRSQPGPFVTASSLTSKMLILPDRNCTRIMSMRYYDPEMLDAIIESYNTSLPYIPSQPSPADIASSYLPSIPESSTPFARVIERFRKLESLINILEERVEEPHKWRWRRSLKRKLAKVWKEYIILKEECEQEQVDKRWSIQEEVANLFDVALKFSYPEFKDEKSTILACIEKYGDYQCENVLSIWPKLRKEGEVHLGPRRVGWKIKKNLELLGSEMLEREPWVLDIGFVSIKLSGKWMAKSIYKMLTDGIDTWAPKLLMESVLVNFPSCNPAFLTQMDLLRRELIKTTLMRMLQYCKIRVEFSMPCEMALPQEQLDMFRIEKRDDGDVLIFGSAGEERESLIHAKRDEWSGDPENDLADLWYGLKEKNADWIVCVTPVEQQEYIKMCIKAAQHAEWLPLDWRAFPRASYTGYQTYNTKLKQEKDLDSFLDEAKSNCEAAAKELGYTGEEVVNCALKYTILKNNRLAYCTFNYEEMLNAEGNTFVYLLNTQARIRSCIEETRKDINDFASELELTLGKGEIWKEGVERVLVEHLLAFTQVIEESCLPVLPHILCEYLYDLSKNFNSVCEVGFVAKTIKLLLCEATGVVMEKCFQLLGITPESSSLGVDWPQESSSGLVKSLLQVERLSHKDPPKITTRFELFSVYPHITRDPNFKEGNLFGQIAISDTYSLLSDGWGLTTVPDHGYVALFDCDWPYSIDITNHRGIYFGNPSSRNLVPISSFMEVRVELYASTERNDTVFELCNRYIDAEFKDFLDGEADTSRNMWISEGKDGHIRMYFILLKDAIDSTIKVTYFPTKDDVEVFIEIFAYYGSDFFDEKVDPFEKNYYTARLFRSTFDPKIPELPLERSMLAVPAKGSIVIVACLWDVKGGDVILNESRTFDTTCSGEQKIESSCGSLLVRVDWS